MLNRLLTFRPASRNGCSLERKGQWVSGAESPAATRLFSFHATLTSSQGTPAWPRREIPAACQGPARMERSRNGHRGTRGITERPHSQHGGFPEPQPVRPAPQQPLFPAQGPRPLAAPFSPADSAQKVSALLTHAPGSVGRAQAQSGPQGMDRGRLGSKEEAGRAGGWLWPRLQSPSAAGQGWGPPPGQL